MTLLQIFVLAAVQGITEFLPISSSAHLILVPHLTGWPDQGLEFDIASHVGTLMAVLLYFRRDVWMIARDMWFYPAHREVTLGVRLFLYLVIGTIPAVIVGLLIKHYFPDGIRSVQLIAINMIVFALIMFAADRYSLTYKTLDHLNIRSALFIGIAQAIALIPGVSRSGNTISASRILGISRVEAARFSMLLAIPAILGAATLAILDYDPNQPIAHLHDILWGIAFSFAVGWVAIAFLMKFLQYATLNTFVAYRILLGAALLAWPSLTS